ncbi:MAG TPA: SIS domain-containing protein [Candidatus Dormibacteraeota bacterium]
MARLLADESAAGAAERLRGCERVFLVGTGTSYHGALVGQFMLRSAGLDAWAVRAFEFANYPPELRAKDGLILLSHRGSKRFSRSTLELFDRLSHRWVAITGEGSALEGDGVVKTVDQELSSVHTASHTGAMVRLAQIASALGEPAWRRALAKLPDAVAAAVQLRGGVATYVSGVQLGPVAHFVGGGPARATAYEGALKLREASHLVSAEGHDIEGILHGPLISIQPGQVVIVIAQPGPALERTQEVADALGEIGAAVLAVGAAAAEVRAAHHVATPMIDEVLSPIVNVIPLQWLAYEAAARLGVEADGFRRDEPLYSAAQSKFTL